MLKRIRIQGYKSFKHLELRLRPLMVLMGPNASGKSNFLDAIHLPSRLVSASNLSEALGGVGVPVSRKVC